jgi:hypothetical protein
VGLVRFLPEDVMSGGRFQRIEVRGCTGAVLGHVRRYVRSGLWRMSGKPPAKVDVSGAELHPSVRGTGREAVLFVRLPEGVPLPKDLESNHG